MDDWIVAKTPCAACDGSGWWIGQACWLCKGSGELEYEGPDEPRVAQAA
jgi:DnaJ-class molecular chaperone